MIIRRITEEIDGEVEVNLAMTKDQATYLMNVGLNLLLSAGDATIKDMSRQEFEKEVTTDTAVDEGVPSPANEQSEEVNNENPTTRH